jgi:hypothetical protein
VSAEEDDAAAGAVPAAEDDDDAATAAVPTAEYDDADDDDCDPGERGTGEPEVVSESGARRSKIDVGATNLHSTLQKLPILMSSDSHSNEQRFFLFFLLFFLENHFPPAPGRVSRNRVFLLETLRSVKGRKF